MRKQIELLSRRLAAYPKPYAADGSVTDEEYRAAKHVLKELTELSQLDMKRVEIEDAGTDEERRNAISAVLAERRDGYKEYSPDMLEAACRHTIALYEEQNPPKS
ncbi:hypothetical protein [Pantoea sp. paga]|uniref:hypothetical protein n=1 Tax=Pantoea sp. paga TaxID=2597519 RepID=UPI00117FE32A|nr:hypothetical protein [Pantoea sp. paga]TSH77916.1 hypothetical protein FOV68_23550 [Pantoea sp. paga]